MPRSRVQTGLHDARDRGTKRRRDRQDLRADPRDLPNAALRSWLAEHVDHLSFEQLERLDLDEYLRATQAIDLAAAERLRRLGVRLETAIVFDNNRRTWAALRRVYDRAIRLSPDDAWMVASMGISAGEIGERASFDDQADVAADLFRQAHMLLREAASRDPADAQIAWAQGHTAYMDRAGGAAAALEHCDRAVALEPKHAWARLYRAHCLHDLERWPDAVEAYDAVPQDAFRGPKSWRADLLVEQRAWCRLKLGDEAGALADFERILARYDKQPHLAQWSNLSYLTQAAEGRLPQLLAPVRALAERLENLPP